MGNCQNIRRLFQKLQFVKKLSSSSCTSEFDLIPKLSAIKETINAFVLFANVLKMGDHEPIRGVCLTIVRRGALETRVATLASGAHVAHHQNTRHHQLPGEFFLGNQHSMHVYLLQTASRHDCDTSQLNSTRNIQACGRCYKGH